MLYPTKDSAWQPVVTSLPSLTEVPKESIIANTDFTTTSLIAKRFATLLNSCMVARDTLQCVSMVTADTLLFNERLDALLVYTLETVNVRGSLLYSW